MNKISQFFYNRSREQLLKEMDEYGLQILDEHKFHVHALKTGKKNMIYTIIFILLIGLIILKWVRQL